MDALHKLENEVIQCVCVEKLAYNLKHMCCAQFESDSKPRAMFSADRLEVKRLDKLPTSCHSPIFERSL